jgi:hypothetical protein
MGIRGDRKSKVGKRKDGSSMYCSGSIKVVRLNPHANFCPPGPDLEKFHPVMAGEQVFGRKKTLYLFHDFLIQMGV